MEQHTRNFFTPPQTHNERMIGDIYSFVQEDESSDSESDDGSDSDVLRDQSGIPIPGRSTSSQIPTDTGAPSSSMEILTTVIQAALKGTSNFFLPFLFLFIPKPKKWTFSYKA